MQPGTQGIAHPERSALANEDKEGRLEGIVRIVFVAEDVLTGTQDHRPMPLHQGVERTLRRWAVARLEALEQLPVGQFRESSAVKQGSEVGR